VIEGVESPHMETTKKGETQKIVMNAFPRENLSRGLRMLKEQYANQFTVPVEDNMWEKRGMFSRTIQEWAMRNNRR